MNRTLALAAALLASAACASQRVKPAEPAAAAAPAKPPAPAPPPAAPPSPVAAPTTPDAPFRASKPAPATGEPRFQAPVPKVAVLANGARLLVVENRAVPLVAIEIVVRAGVDMEPEGKGGLAGFTADMLTEGTARRQALEFAARVEDLAARLSAGADLESARLRLNGLTETLPEALDLLAEALLTPAFRPEDVERVRGIRLTGLEQKKATPQALAADQAARIVYGERHPRGRPSGGTPESIRAITIADLKGFHAAYYDPKSAIVSVSGDVSAAEVKKLLDQRLAGWKGRRGAEPKRPAFPTVAARSVTLVDKPGASQSQVWVVGELFPAGHADRVPMAVLNNVLGGLFGSRLNQNLRETKGYSYGVRSSLRLDSDRGWLVAAGGLQSRFTAESVTEFEKELAALATGELRDGELAQAKEALIRGLPVALETNDAVAGSLATVAALKLPLDWYAQLPGRIARVQAADVARVARAWIRPGRMPIIVVGPRAEAEEKLKALDLGPFTVR
jgi:zinc protease